MSLLRYAKYNYLRYFKAYFVYDEQYLTDLLNLEDKLFSSTNSNNVFWEIVTRWRLSDYLSRSNQISVADKYFSTLLSEVKENSNFRYLTDRFIDDYAMYLCVNSHYEKAKNVITHYNSPLTLHSDHKLLEYNIILTFIYSGLQDQKQFDHYLSLAEGLITKNHVCDINAYTILRKRAEYYSIYSNNTDKAFDYFLRAKKVLSSLQNAEIEERILDYNIGEYLYYKKDYSRAIDYMEKSLKNFLNHSEDPTYFKKELSDPSFVYPVTELYYLAFSYFYYSKLHGYNIKSLERSYHLLKLTAKFRELTYSTTVSDERHEYELRRLIFSYTYLTNIGYEVMIRNHDSTMIDDFFTYSENSKFITLKSLLTNEMAMNAAGIPEDIMTRMVKLRKEMDELQIDMDTHPNDITKFSRFPVDVFIQKKREASRITKRRPCRERW